MNTDNNDEKNGFRAKMNVSLPFVIIIMCEEYDLQICFILSKEVQVILFFSRKDR